MEERRPKWQEREFMSEKDDKGSRISYRISILDAASLEKEVFSRAHNLGYWIKKFKHVLGY